MSQDNLPLHSNYLLTIPLLGAALLFALAMALLAIALLKRLVKIPGLSMYHSRLGSIALTIAVLYFPISLGCIALGQWQGGQLFQHNHTLYSKDDLTGGGLAIVSQYTDQGEVDAYVEHSYGYKPIGKDIWGSPIYVDRMGNRHEGCSMSYGETEKENGVEKVKVRSFDCP